MQELISILIPFYNEEKYLAKALSSAIGQTYPNIEVIAVNDGSTDDSLRIANDFAKRYPHIHIISTANKGLGHARNVGVTAATGAYLTFLDSDDELHATAISVWYNKIKGENADIVISRFDIIDAQTGAIRKTSGWKGDGKTCSSEEALNAVYTHGLSSTVWAKLYRTSVAKQLRFPENYWFEDRPFLLKYLLHASAIAFEESSQINILSRNGSITRRLIAERRIKETYDMYAQELETIISSPYASKFIPLIDIHQLNAMLETLIILYYDRKHHPAIASIKKSYTIYANLFITEVKRHGTKLSLGSRANLALIQFPGVIGWQLLFCLLPVLKRKKCQAVSFLRYS